MKLLGWGLAVLFAVWLTAFTWIKWSDLGCSQDWTICVHETGIWFRKLVLLEWASKWQPLLAAIAALLAGACILISTKWQISVEKRKQEKSALEEARVSCTLMNRFFFDIGLAISNNDYHGPSHSKDVFDRCVPVLAKISPDLATVSLSCLRDVSNRVYMTSFNDNNRFVFAADCFAMSRILEHVGSNLSQQGNYAFAEKSNIAPSWLKNRLESIAISEGEMGLLRAFFKWQ